MRTPIAAAILSAVLIAAPMPLHAASVTIAATYKADVMSTVDGGVDRRVVALDNLDIVADFEFAPPLGLDHFTMQAHALNNLGKAPNDHAGTLQGVNNIEVGQNRVKLYQLWADIGFLDDQASLRAGLYDLNSEFYQTPASGVLIAPAFGIGSELASTGPNGPSIFPSTALTVRLRVQRDEFYVQTAVLNAMAGTIGDDQGVALSGRDGALGVAEAGIEGPKTKFGIGVWGYSKRQPSIVAPGLADNGRTARSHGVYALGQSRLAGGETGRNLHGFVRGGISDGKTTPFSGGIQAGLLAQGIRGGDEDSALTIGANAAFLSSRYRVPGSGLSRAEIGLEISYRDRLIGPLMIQPDIQYIINAGGDRRRNALVVGMRFQIDFDLLSSK